MPLGWTVKWDWRIADSTAPHSLVVMAEREKLPLEGGRPAFTNAMTRLVTAGLAAGPERPDHASRPMKPAGTGCCAACPAMRSQGEWLGLRVDPEAKTAERQEK